jgi:uncharacterized protein YndB with AHSA1/START domain
MEGNQKAGTVEMSKNFPVPVERLFEAWNEPEQLKQWWHPLNNHLESVKNELKEGGTIEYEFENHKLHIRGNYKEVSKNEKLVYSWNWELADEQVKNAEYILSVDFIPEENGSRLQIRQEGFENEVATKPHKDGWEQGLTSLEAFLQGGSSGAASDSLGAAGEEEQIPVMPSAYDQAGGTDASGLGSGKSGSGGLTQQEAGTYPTKEESSDPGMHQQFGGGATIESSTENQQQGNVGADKNVKPSSNTTNATQENFDPAKPENSVTPEY